MHEQSAKPRALKHKGKLIGQKAPLKPKEVWAIRARLQMEPSSHSCYCYC